MEVNNIIKFYRDAYQHEYRTEKILNFYSSNVSHVYYPTDFSLLSEPAYELPVDSAWGSEAYAELQLSSSERKLIVGAFFIKGRISVLGKPKKLFAPLFLMDAQLSLVEEVYVLKINHDTLGVNPTVLDYLNGQSDEAVDRVDFFLSNSSLPSGQFTFDGLFELSNVLQEKYNFLDISMLDARMKGDDRLCDMASIYHSRNKRFENLLMPDIAVGIVDKPVKSKGVINELSVLAERAIAPTSVLTKLFTHPTTAASIDKGKNAKPGHSIVPVSLSADQENIIQSAASAQLTLTIGPPGTGKSFSIAALAIQAAHEGKKVLIASKNEQACAVIYKKINSDIGVRGIALNASKARYKMSVATKLKNIGLGIGVRRLNPERSKKLKNEVQILQSTVDRLSRTIAEREKEEMKWGRQLAIGGRGLFRNVQKKWIKYKYGKKVPIWQEKYALHRHTRELKRKEKQLISLTYKNRLYQLLQEQRFDIIELEKAYQQQHGNLAQQIFSRVNFEVALSALPIWICKSTNLADIFPLRENLFDLVIIDEASQCDIASSIPLLYRAEAAVVVGDPNQLRHVSFISRNKEAELRSNYNVKNQEIKYRDMSILDLVNVKLTAQQNLIFLSEHYRSMPDIIDFSNKEFYAGALKVMTSNPRTDQTDNLRINYVAGQRDEKGKNELEAAAILSKLSTLIDEESTMPGGTCTSVGIISPFRAQVDLLKKMVKAEVAAADIKKHDILIGTPYTFQGEEKDLIYLSFGVDDATHGAVFRYLDKPDVFNVSITRAKLRQEVFVSVAARTIRRESLLYRYISNKYHPAELEPDQDYFDSFMVDVTEFLQKNYDQVFQNRVISGVLLDLLVAKGNKVFAIDLVGYPGMFEEQLSIESIRRLERVDIEVFILPFSSWHFDPDYTKKHLKKFIEK